MKNQYEITGTIYKILSTEQKSEKFRNRQLVLELADENPKYTQHVAFEFNQDKCEQLDQFIEGETVTITFNLRGREYNGRFYTSNAAWRIVRP